MTGSGLCLEAVRTFADKVMAHGRDTYGDHRTPLLVDGVDIYTHEPGRWVNGRVPKRAPDGHGIEVGDEWVLSNLSSQQILFRVLDALTTITGEPAYRRTAEEATAHALANLRAPNGLLYWGGHMAFDLLTKRPVYEGYGHELEHLYPYWELMWRVDPAATREVIEAFWGSHVCDWSTLDMNRHGWYDQSFPGWDEEYVGGDPFFLCEGLSFYAAGSELLWAAAFLHRQTGDPRPLEWARRLAGRYVDTRDPVTGLSGNQYGQLAPDSYDGGGLGDRTRRQLGPEFGDRALEAKLLIGGGYYAYKGLCQLLMAEMLEGGGAAFRRWALEDLTILGRRAYDPATNTSPAMFTDGTILTPDRIARSGYHGPPANFNSRPLGTTFLWAYAMAFRIAGDPFHWEMARHLARGNGLGEIGAEPGAEPGLTVGADPHAAAALLELHDATGHPAFFEGALASGERILDERFHRGFFVRSRRHRRSRFDSFDAWLLLHLHARSAGLEGAVPTLWPSSSYFICYWLERGRQSDGSMIYNRTLDEAPA